jgi:uncharacterized protein (TIRG00374 family)
LVSERLLDAVALAVLFVALTFSGIANSPVGKRWAVVAIAAIALGLAGAFAFLALRRRGRLQRFADAIRPFARATRTLLGHHGALLGGVTLGIWLLEGVIFWLVAQSLDLNVSFVEAVFLLVLAAFFSLVPAAPGYVGTFDAAVLFGLRALDVVGGQAVAYAVLVRFVIFFPITVVGLIVLVTRYGGLAQLRRRPAMASA